LGSASAFLCSSQAGHIMGQNIALEGGAFPGDAVGLRVTDRQTRDDVKQPAPQEFQKTLMGRDGFRRRLWSYLMKGQSLGSSPDPSTR
jgi:hypothetical protein